ncbi:unnamed protein product [Scytosiphon promiscuus]
MYTGTARARGASTRLSHPTSEKSASSEPDNSWSFPLFCVYMRPLCGLFVFFLRPSTRRDGKASLTSSMHVVSIASIASPLSQNPPRGRFIVRTPQHGHRRHCR